MDIRFYIDPDTDEPHIYGHGILEEEVLQVLRGPGEDLPARNNSRMKLGRTIAGRSIKVVYVMDEDKSGVFVITAHELGTKAKKALRKRQRRKGK